jgi:DNA repair exonuclease SbcCD nuclease subunit
MWVTSNKSDTRVIGILTSDWHLSLKPPKARAVEPSWFGAMKRPLDEIRMISQHYKCPIFVAGDILHHYNEPAELINWIIQQLEGLNIYLICGQHDLSMHNYEDIQKSAYWTLVKAEVLKHLDGPDSFGPEKKDFWVYGFGWEQKITTELDNRIKGEFRLALVHKYIWKDNKTKYPNAPKENNAKNLAAQLKGYNVAAFGDNHLGFNWTSKDLTIFNSGSLIPRNIDQRKYRPMVGLLKEDGTVIPHFLDTSKDKWIEVEELPIKPNIDFSKLAKEFKELASDEMDFTEIVKQRLKEVDIDIRAKEIVIEILEGMIK